jgi:hypothetical protein
LVDLDGDGRTDILSGSWPGEIYFFRRQADGKFAEGVTLKGHDGKPVNVGSAASAFAFDWDGDGKPDLVVGTILGEVWLVPNESDGKALAFGKPCRLEAAGQPIKVGGDAAPVVADWDGDGKPDLVVGAEDGSVVWYRNVGDSKAPRLEAARPLVGASPLGWGSDEQRGPRDWGLRVKPCVFDWDGDGRPDLLLGDRCGSFNAKPDQTAQEKDEERKANDRLPPLRKKWADVFARYRQSQDAAERDVLRAQLQRLRDELAVVQEVQGRYRPGYQAHGFVWVFLRKAADQ